MASRFERVQVVPDTQHLEHVAEAGGSRSVVPTQLLPDQSRSLIRQNDSPDIPFRFSINPYRGCEHGCAYCYARPGHETLGMNAGIDFETKIVVKYDAARLLRSELCRHGWRGEPIAMSGVTDCYQPVERGLKLTRACLEVMHEARQAVGIVTKNALILRDRDLLVPMAARNLARVRVSLTTLDAALARAMEPRTATPEARLGVIGQLTEAGVPVGVMVAPVIPGLTDHEIPRILKAAREAGAVTAGFQLLRLPLSVGPVFLGWLSDHYPQAKGRVESLIRATREGRLSQSEFGRRMQGDGPYADGIRATFRLFARKFGLGQPLPPLDCSQFRPPNVSARQLRLF